MMVVVVDVEQLKLELVEAVVVAEIVVVVIASFFEQHPVFCSEQPHYEPPEGGGELVLAISYTYKFKDLGFWIDS